MQTSRYLEVFYHGRKVGTLAEMPNRKIAFQYSSEWQRDGFSISPFSLPLNNDVFTPNDRALDRFGGLFGVFADSLPDSWGQLLLERHLRSLGIERESISALDRLAYVGRSGMGALEYIPSKESDFDVEKAGLDFDTIAGECEKILSSKTSEQLDILYKMGGSSGGTRPKILLSEGDKEWIVKFPAKNDPGISGKREYDYSLCAKDCGIIMTETELIPSAICEGYFKTERFDRRGGDKIFTATFAGLLEADFRTPSCDYESYFKLVRVLTKDNSVDKDQLYKTMCFNVLAHNKDDHTKNFSFIHTDKNGWRLAPAYDLTYSDTYWGEHTTSVNGRGKDITKGDLVQLGVQAEIPKETCEKEYEEILSNIKVLESYLSGEQRKDRGDITYKKGLGELLEKLSERMGNL